jgi:uncharacterized OB-fold protein
MTALSVALPGDRIRIATNRWTEPFWEAARENKLVAAQCENCGTFRMPPTPYCPRCRSQAIRWPELPGTATIYSFTICMRSPYPDVPDFTYIPVIVDLDGALDARLISCLVDARPQDVAIGQKVAVHFWPINDGWRLPIFREAKG